jgi:hypothetical protein
LSGTFSLSRKQRSLSLSVLQRLIWSCCGKPDLNVGRPFTASELRVGVVFVVSHRRAADDVDSNVSQFMS